MDVGGHDPEVLALSEDSIQLFIVTDGVRVFVVQEDRRPVVRTLLRAYCYHRTFVANLGNSLAQRTLSP